MAKDGVVNVITKLINRSIKNSEIPEQMKISLIRPIYKNGDHCDYQNYRPIAVSSVITKIL